MKRNLLFTLTALFFIWTVPAWTQPDFERLQAPVSANGDPFENPFTGGLNNPQPNKVDLNNDGVDDLFVFERNGNLVQTYLFAGQPGEVKYTFAPEYAVNFPTMVNWVLLRDYNGDGIQDIFAHYPAPINGITVYRGYYDADNKIAFEQYPFWDGYPDCLYFEQINGSTTPIYVNNVDYPVVDDVDGDGDLDVLTFNTAGGWVDYLQNRSVQLGYGKDSLIFKKADFCWGKFYEASFSEEIILSDNPNQCADGLTGDPSVVNRHPGSTLVTFDADGDGDLEVAIGDINFGKINYLTNGGTPQNAWMTGQDSEFPSYDVPVQIPVFPVPFFLDLDNDGKDDFVAAPNNVGGTPNYEVLWFYRNINTQEEPIFELVQQNALVDETLDFGSGSHPAFLDFDSDGLMDLLVGTDGYYDQSFTSTRDPRLILLRNSGTETEPAFELVDDDFLELSQYGNETWNFAPAVGDIDKDGDADLLIGEQDGRIFFSENTGGPGNPAQFQPVQFNWMGIDVGLNSHPTIADLNRDGMPDLVIGERNGNFNYFQNIGTPGNADFVSDVTQSPNNPILGNVSTELPADLSAGNSAPLILDYGDSFLMIAGTQAGPVQVYSDIQDNLGGTFTLSNPNLGSTRESKRSTVAFADLNGDGYFEMVVGNVRGGLSLFSTPLDATVPTSAFQRLALEPVRVFPNPAQTYLTLEWPGEGVGTVEVRLFNALGQLILTDRASGIQWTLPVENLQPGLYAFEILGAEGQRAVVKWVKE